MNGYPSGTVTFLFTDIEGSTKLWEQQPTSMQAALTHHDALLQEAIETHHGRLIKSTGDGVLAVFPAALDAVGAAREAQAALQDPFNELRLKVRMGLHSGEAELRGGDYYGQALNRAARIMTAAHGGQVLLSVVTGELVREQLSDGMSLVDLGEHRLKDLVRPERLYQLIAPGLPDDFPPIPSLNTLPNNLPVQLTSFIGRERELAEALRTLSTARLLSFTGPGGTGKTRLSVQLAFEALSGFKDGAWLVELAPLSDPAHILPAIATVFGLREGQGMPLAQLVIDYLRGKQVLLILDNCEHLIDACARLADQLLHACAEIKIIASSREALGVAGEAVLRVPSLDWPDPPFTPEAIMQHEATRLFVERAAQVEPRFRLGEGNAAAIVQICRRLDGIPLAIELAASRVKLFTPEQIAARLNDRFRLLAGGSRTAVPRQQTLTALIDWSYGTLTEIEQHLLRRLAVFSGGWTFEAAAAVAGEIDVLEALQGLVNKSLVIVEERGGEARYRYLETIRQYAMMKLVETDEAGEARDRHLNYFLGFAGRSEDASLLGNWGSTWRERMQGETDNLRSALEWALEERPEEALKLAESYGWFLSARGAMTEARAWGSQALSRADETPPAEGMETREHINLRGRLLIMMAWAAIIQGDHQTGRALAEEGATLFRQLGNDRLLARILSIQALANTYLGNTNLALAAARESETIGREKGHKMELAMTLTTLSNIHMFLLRDEQKASEYMAEAALLSLGSASSFASAIMDVNIARAAFQRGNMEEALLRMERVLAFYREVGDRRMVNTSQSEIAHAWRKRGEYEKALPIYRQTLVEWKELGHRAAAAHEMECFAFIAEAQGEPGRAARLLGAAEALREVCGSPMTPLERVEYDQAVSQVRSEMEEASFAGAWASGRTMTMEEGIAYALE